MSTENRSEPPDRSSQRESLTRTIQAEIIPRLMLAHRIGSKPVLSTPSPEANAGSRFDADGLARSLLDGRSTEAITTVSTLRTQGATIEAIFLELLAPAARRMGELWETDEATFTAVTIGLTHLQQIVRQFSPAFEIQQRVDGAVYRAVLAPAPGDQHVFGLILLEEFFRRAGWDVIGAADSAECDLVELVRSEPISLIGFSIADRRALPALKTLIHRLRGASCSDDLLILIGGNCVLNEPATVGDVGADGTAATPREALAIAQRHIESRDGVVETR